MKHAHILLKSMFVFCSLFSYGVAKEMILNTNSEHIALEFDPSDSIETITKKVSLLIDKADNFLIEISLDEDNPVNIVHIKMHKQGKFLGYPRNYYAAVTEKEKADIRLIVTTLANKPLISLAAHMSELENAGDRIDHLHPLKFLMTVFTDEELKVGVRNIRNKGWVWQSFIGGIKDTLAVEASINNLDEYVIDFAEKVKIDPNLIQPAIQSRSWDQFIKILIDNIPRQGNHGRYNC